MVLINGSFKYLTDIHWESTMCQVLRVYLVDSAAEEIYWHTFDWNTLVYPGPSHLVEELERVMREERTSSWSFRSGQSTLVSTRVKCPDHIYLPSAHVPGMVLVLGRPPWIRHRPCPEATHNLVQKIDINKELQSSEISPMGDMWTLVA